MEEEMNYLSEKIERLEENITELDRLSKANLNYKYSAKQVRKEKEILENILNKLTEIALM